MAFDSLDIFTIAKVDATTGALFSAYSESVASVLNVVQISVASTSTILPDGIIIDNSDNIYIAKQRTTSYGTWWNFQGISTSGGTLTNNFNYDNLVGGSADTVIFGSSY